MWVRFCRLRGEEIGGRARVECVECEFFFSSLPARHEGWEARHENSKIATVNAER